VKKLHILPSKIKSGLFHHRAIGEYQGLPLHLRVEEDGSGVLIINASRMLFLNRTATEHVHLFLDGKNEEEAAKELRKKFNVEKETAMRDYRDILFIINTFAKTNDVDPVSYLGVEKIEPFEKELSAPYMMDLAVTYRCDINCNVRASHPMSELSTDEWFMVIDKLHALGIPHIIFTGGEPTLRDDLDKLISYTQKTGLVNGLETNGRKLRDNAYLNHLIEAGLDHIQIAVETHDEEIHDKISGVSGSWQETIQGLKNAIATPVYTISNTTINQYNADDILKTVDFLHDLALTQFTCNNMLYFDETTNVSKEIALDEESINLLIIKIADYAEILGMDFFWYTPQNHMLKSSELKEGITDTIACRTNLYIEPDGTVIPYQNYLTPLGNILTDNWNKIWNNPICNDLRNKKQN
jgi:MoaA/NifB/PqqE/SkfB family radical SAM enzyme